MTWEESKVGDAHDGERLTVESGADASFLSQDHNGDLCSGLDVEPVVAESRGDGKSDKQSTAARPVARANLQFLRKISFGQSTGSP